MVTTCGTGGAGEVGGAGHCCNGMIDITDGLVFVIVVVVIVVAVVAIGRYQLMMM